MGSTALALVLGLLVGLRHAFEPDHLTAVSTLVTDARGPRHGAALGALWGVGHTISLVVVGTVLAVVGETLPERVGVAFELAVAAMLLVLGVRAIARGVAHEHEHEHGHGHVHGRLRPLAVGLVHGLAGSGALTALVFAQLPGFAARVTYMALFGLGSVGGMAIASGVAGTVLQATSRSMRARRGFGIATGIVSIGVGVAWGIPLLV